jgi:acetyl-CoA carboxylase biotin carboxyl carrier protein
MSGNLWKVLVQSGDHVEAGQEVAILESVKMEIPVTAEAAGRVKKVIKQERGIRPGRRYPLHP